MDDVRETEHALGVALPDEFVRFMKVRQGMALDTAQVTDAAGRTIRIGHFYCFTDNEAGHSNIRELCLLYRRRGYPQHLVAFASVGSQAHLALDYAGSPSRPAVVFVYPDGDAERTGYWSTSAVTTDVASFLALLTE